MVNWITFVIIAVVLVTLDKGLTYASIRAVEKNYPTVDPLTIEKNPAAKWFFSHFGFEWGSVLFGIVSVVSFFVALGLLFLTVRSFFPSNPWGISLYVMFLVYGFVIINNVYMLLKHSNLL